MLSERKAANALSGKTARPCDGCSKKRARWFCAADNAFLCQSCDESVHSANQLARRHERVRLQSSSFKPTALNESVPAWHQGFTKKARTTRHNNSKKNNSSNNNSNLPLVPEIGNEEEGNSFVPEEDDDHLLYRVPVFDPFEAELCKDDLYIEEGNEIGIGNDNNERMNMGLDNDLDDYYLPSDLDLAEFAADVENLLGSGVETDSPNDLGLLEYCNKKEEHDEHDRYNNSNNTNTKLCLDEKKVVKIKDEGEVDEIVGIQMGKETLVDWSLSYDEILRNHEEEEEEEEEEEKVLIPQVTNKTGQVKSSGDQKQKKENKRNVLLRLNYEAIITAWASHGSPWTTGTPPQINPDDCWPHCLGTCPNGDGHRPYGGHILGNGAREARVLRYKEKRRTRLFSKKIRYEVRKLNAEKRPRMQGRFVKRTSFLGTCFS